MTFDVLIKSARVFPGDSPALLTDVGIAGDRITTVEHSLPATNAAEVIDATGLMLCPGFIDMHAHTAPESFSSHCSYVLPAKNRKSGEGGIRTHETT
jgi:N-acyl-D-aspartate/D-glutamate deacylase